MKDVPQNTSGGKGKNDFGPLFATVQTSPRGAPKAALMVPAHVARTEAFTAWEADITPEIAREWLKRNHDQNRRPRPNRMSRYRRQMISGDWPLTHQGIAFNKNGALVDGQHRLMTLASCPDGTVIRVLVFQYNTESDAFGVLDIGITRTGGDALAIGGHVDKHSGKNTAATVNSMFQAINGSSVAATVGELSALYALTKPSVDWAVSSVRRNKIQAPVVAAFAYAHPVAPARIEQVAEMVITAVGLVDGTAEHTLHRFISDGSSYVRPGTTARDVGTVDRGGNLARLDATYKVLGALKAAILGVPVRRLYGVRPGEEGLPQAMEFFMQRRAELGLSTGKKG